jgi:hypothetical protein
MLNIPYSWRAVEAHDWKTNETQDHVEYDDGSTEVVLITSPTRSVHDNGGQSVWRSNKTLGCADVEAHVE